MKETAYQMTLIWELQSLEMELFQLTKMSGVFMGNLTIEYTY